MHPGWPEHQCKLRIGTHGWTDSGHPQVWADIGLAFDGDADRLIAVDQNGRQIVGDQLIAICAQHIKKKVGLITTALSPLS